MLQLPVVALEQRIKQELEVNPLLEEIVDIAQESDQDFDQEAVTGLTERRTEEPESAPGEGSGESEERRTEEVVREQEYDWDEYVSGDYEGYKAPSFTGQDSEEQEEFPQRAEQSLSENLLAQLRMQLMSDDELALAEEIIGNIDDHGYLRRDLREIIEDLNKFIAGTRRAATAAAARTTVTQFGDGRFEAYEDVRIDEPFGRERLVANILDDSHEEDTGNGHHADMDDLPVDPFSISFDDEDFPRNGGNGRSSNGSNGVIHPNGSMATAAEPAMATASASAATLSLEEMSRLSIEDLAALLEQGTAALAPPMPVPSGNDMPQMAADMDSTMVAEDVPQIFSLEEGERVLYRIQRLDPPGIGARDLRECLMVQLEIEQTRTPAHRLALRMIQETYNEFTMKHFEKSCHRLGCSIDELKDAIEVIKTLNPKPGEGSTSIMEDNYLTPDFVIERDDEDFVIVPTDRHIPILRINRAYQELMRRGNGRRKEVDRDTRKFIRDKFEAAKWFIASIQQRRQTMMKVMRAIVDLQMDFFLHGPNQIRPMIYKDVAERIGMDISTVCRVVNGKYTQTDYGTFELRYFFSEKLETTSGEEVSTKIVKSRIQELIDAEDKSKPLSDDAISKEMEDAGFYVARRTVAKYREQLNIPVARLRRAL